ncbi:16S rRNA (guanine(527)-N(7))-methyltransferase RsmG [Meiothermus sp. PNK-Is4]|nr:16S rRNA (guanine(527)-N(7))-methyltransferase RsmG [Meiothermus sp. Pnk-1]RYM29427.1 16S rRNA (guanine(527)-N(7))-methyltransferase RsmG [Meiothermus sp. PNK-Is4]
MPALSARQLEQLGQLYDLLLAANAKTNLTAITDERGFVLKHVVDSLTCGLTRKLEGRQRVIDVGSGAGFPGLPLKIAWPALEMTLLEATRKKVEYLNGAIRALGLRGVSALWGRAEEQAHRAELREVFDRAVVRAVGSAATVAELCLPFVRVGGYLLVQKGPEAEVELAVAQRAIHTLGGRLVELLELRLPEVGDRRKLLLIEKIAETPQPYPRRAGLPAKHPLC